MRPILIKYLTSLLALGLVSMSCAQAGDTPQTLAGTRLVSAQEVAKSISNGAKLIDTRIASEYSEGHIKGATNIPYREKSDKSVNFDASQDQFDIAKLPTNKAMPIVMYCNGPECWKSFKAAAAAIKAGYTNIEWYRDGFPDWQSKGLPVE
jgi:rhodanese-related sulfurtransferase